jgi:hypothetical protein
VTFAAGGAQRSRGGLLWVTAAALSIFAGCGGGGGSGVPVTSTNVTGQTLTAQFSVTIPAKSTGSSVSRRPMYVSPSTQSFAVTAIYGTASPGIPEIVDTTPSSPGCSATPAGLLCNISVQVLRGATALAITAFDQINGRGNALAATTVTIAQTSADVIGLNVTLNGIVSHFTMSLEGGSFEPGISGSKILDINAYDQDGNFITLPGNYNAPIALVPSDPAISVFPNFVTAAGQTVIATYDGTPTASTSITGFFTSNTSVIQVIRAVGSLPAPSPGPVPSVTPNPGATTIVIIH